MVRVESLRRHLVGERTLGCHHVVMDAPETQYVTVDGAEVAYQALGEGSRQLRFGCAEAAIKPASALAFRKLPGSHDRGATGRHAGHADTVRERIDGAEGR